MDRSQDPAVILTILTFYIHPPICRSWSISRRGHSPISQWGKLLYDLLEVLLHVSDRGKSEIQVPSSLSSSLLLLEAYQYCLNGSHAKKCLRLAEFQQVSGRTKLTAELLLWQLQFVLQNWRLLFLSRGNSKVISIWPQTQRGKSIILQTDLSLFQRFREWIKMQVSTPVQWSARQRWSSCCAESRSSPFEEQLSEAKLS